MAETGMFGFHVVQPPGLPGLAFAVQAPPDWREIALPEDQTDLSKPTAFLPLAIFCAPYGAVLLTVAARPAFDDGGTIAEWLTRHCTAEGLPPNGLRRRTIHGLDAVTAEATQASEMGPMRMWLTMLEYDGNLVVVGAMAPEAIWPSVEPTYERMINTYRPVNHKHQTVPIGLLDEQAVEATSSVEATQPVEVESAGQPTDAAPSPEAADASEQPQYVSPPGRPATHAELALADDAASLDPELEFNAYFRDNGIGLVPNVLAVDEGRKAARVGCGAITATAEVPFGWHVIDDGRRTLVFDRANNIQVNFNLLDPTSVGVRAVLESILQHHRNEQPQLEHMITELDGIPTLAMRNLTEGDDPIERAYLIKPIRGEPSLHLQTRVTAVPSEMTRAMDLAEVLMRSMRFAAEDDLAAGDRWVERARSDPRGQDEDYVRHAEALEREDRLEEMEELVQIAAYNQSHPWPAVLAGIYEKRLRRMLQEGRRADAIDARTRAINAIRAYAAGATSGGEGAALSREADHFIAGLPTVE